MKNILVLDNGCSGHITGNSSLLSDFEEKVGPVVSYGDGNTGRTLGYVKIKVGNVIIENVALVDGLKHNLLSVSQLTDRGYDVKFTSTHAEVGCKKTGKVALIGPRLDNMYVAKLHLNTDDGPIKCFLSRASVDESWNWEKKQRC